MLEKLSGDAVEPDQLAQLHEIGLSQPLRPAQGPGGAEVGWWKLGSIVLELLACSTRESRRSDRADLGPKHALFSVFSRMTLSTTQDSMLLLTQSPKKIDQRFYRLVIAKCRQLTFL